MNDFIKKSEALENLKKLPASLDSETVQRCIETISNMPTIEAIPIEFIKNLHKEAIEYRDRWRKWSLAWRRADEQAIGLYSVLQVWEDRHG